MWIEENIGKLEALGIVGMSLLTARLGVLFVPLVLLVFFNIGDYITGLLAAPCRGQKRSSDKGFLGIAKKICMWILVGVGVGVDILLAHISGIVDIEWPFSFLIGCLVCIWLLANEMISLTENISDLGVAVPPFLLPIVKWVKQSAEDKAEKVLPESEKESIAEKENPQGEDLLDESETGE